MFNSMIESVSREPGIALAAWLGSAALIMVTAIGVTALIAVQWRRVRQSEEVSALKHALLAQGFSAEEIVLVIEAGQKNHGSSLAQAARECLTAGRR